MRIHFNITECESMVFEYKGTNYSFSELIPLAEKRRPSANVYEYVYKLPNNEFVYITVVGDEEQPSGNGIYKGWYVIEPISEDDANFIIDALSKFTALYK